LEEVKSQACPPEESWLSYKKEAGSEIKYLIRRGTFTSKRLELKTHLKAWIGVHNRVEKGFLNSLKRADNLEFKSAFGQFF
jgi:hypothetical protein